MTSEIALRVLQGMPDIEPGDDLAGLLAQAAGRSQLAIRNGDVLVVAQKIVSKSEGRYVHLPGVQPSREARELATRVHKDPRKVQVILDESRRVVRAAPPRSDQTEGVLITEHRLGFVCANAAVDESNIDRPDSLLLLPAEPDDSARRLQQALAAVLGAEVGVVISDTFGRPWRRGLVNVAIGIAGIPALADLTGSTDAYGRTLKATVPALADEIAAASGLLMAKAAGTPVVLFNGLRWQADPTSSAQDLLRPETEDLFR
ncbi:coenzyme F420-0:L-glutamate ligase [Salinisphaera sp.]|uniref:coenzyme F420-0:L-glutamate ligase n=1 Tax=Salinisphaera sp. TaxID=1914330 RepID=UPI002D7A1ADF|nr:coenzyme F420-0:L-glutamate ligase [Salinisphaera sp.]HET7313877.1 coenzyme F420-0:L-glutamate ligase [Salinisphaera sp.]